MHFQLRFGSYYAVFFISALLLSGCARPIADFSYPAEVRAPADIQFTNTSEGAEAYEWDFGDGATSEEVSPVHRYIYPGIYTVTLRAFKEGKARVQQQQVVVAPPERCLVHIETPFGDMIAQLYDATPQHQDNFTKLVEQGFYDSLLFHRVIEGFMIQGGDPESRKAESNKALGSGGPGYTVPAEFVDSLLHYKGALSAARTGDQFNPQKRSSGSQFYIVQGKELTDRELDVIESRKNMRYTQAQRERYKEVGGTPFLDREYTVFGKIIDGLEVIDRIAAQPTNPNDRPRENIWMKITLIK